MAYVYPDMPSKAAVKRALKAGAEIIVKENTPTGPKLIKGPITVYLEGPHYPKPHTWYGKARVDENSRLISIS